MKIHWKSAAAWVVEVAPIVRDAALDCVRPVAVSVRDRAVAVVERIDATVCQWPNVTDTDDLGMQACGVEKVLREVNYIAPLLCQRTVGHEGKHIGTLVRHLTSGSAGEPTVVLWADEEDAA